MKAFLILVLLFLVFLVIASTSLANVDLTPNTPSQTNVVEPANGPSDVITINNGAVPASQVSTGETVPVTGSCSNPYTVQPGDMLSRISMICNTSIASIRLANPQITNANLIYPGQQLVIPGTDGTNSNSAQAVAQQPAEQPAQSIQVQAPSAVEQSAVQPTVAPQVPVSGNNPLIIAGTPLQVKAINYPPNTAVNVAIGPQTVGYNIVATGVTDAAGSLMTNITVPAAPDSTTPWVVVVATTSKPTIQAMSKPFFIGAAR